MHSYTDPASSSYKARRPSPGALTLACGIVLLSGVTAQADLSGLLGYWPFAEGAGTTTADATNNNDGTLVGSSWVASPWTFALDFDGGDYVDLGDPAGAFDFDETQSFSIAAWIKPDVVDNVGRRFISKRGAENIGFDLGVWSGSQGVFAELSDGATETSTADFFDVPVPAGRWSFVVAVVDRNEATLRVYVNALEAEATLDIFGIGSLSGDAPLNFGRASGNSARSFVGGIDEVQIYSRALSAADVQELFASMQSPLSFVTQPVSQTVEEGQPVTFTATLSGSPPYFIQWLSNGTAIEGATNSSYTISATTLGMSGTTYSAIVSNLYPSSITSTGAVLTVAHDLTPPALVQVFSRSANQLFALFSEPLSPATAQTAGNFTLTNAAGQAITITSAVLGTDELGVTLVPSSPLVEDTDYFLVVSGIQDVSTPPNTVLPGSTQAFRYNTLVGYWPFEEGGGTNVADLSGYGNDGLVSGSQTWADGKVGKALVFDGNDDYVDVGDAAGGILDFGATDSFSYGAWIKPALLDTTGRRIISKRNDSDVGYELSVINRNGHGVFAELGDGSTAPSTYDAGILLPLNIDQWYHVMVVVDRAGGELRLYLDGSLQGTVDVSSLGSLEISEPLNFGRASGNSARSFGGTLDEIRIYSRVLSAEEIASLASPPAASPQFSPPIIANGEIRLNWTGTGQLEWASSLLGPWTPVSPNPTPPYSEPVVQSENRFFRLNAGPKLP